MCLISDADLVLLLAKGYTVQKVSEEKKINRRTLESRIEVLKERCFSATHAQLVAHFMHKKLIDLGPES
jgi:hypothetical protein